ncbi:hypothetical protein [Alteripontixanthobacter maritimus]|nr:hypothetical protein [Alteripontixanthobacter maritimus]
MTQTLQTYRSTAQRAAIVLAVFFQIGSTFLPNLGFGEPIGDRSDDVRTLITPAGWAFAIWGPLFFGSIVFAIYQALPKQHHNALLKRIGWFAAAALAGNGVWATWTTLNEISAPSAVIIAATLVCFLIVLRVFVRWADRFTTGERWCAVLPLSALAAWLTAATIVNISASLKYHGVDAGDAAASITAAIIVVGGVIAAFAILRSEGNPWYTLVFLWALLAIYLKGGQEAQPVALAAFGSGLLVMLAALARLRNPANRAHWFG